MLGWTQVYPVVRKKKTFKGQTLWTTVFFNVSTFLHCIILVPAQRKLCSCSRTGSKFVKVYPWQTSLILKMRDNNQVICSYSVTPLFYATSRPCVVHLEKEGHPKRISSLHSLSTFQPKDKLSKCWKFLLPYFPLHIWNVIRLHSEH